MLSFDSNIHEESMGRRSDINWNEVELDFRLGQLSIREIAKKHSISDSNLRARAKRLAWQRDDGEVARIATQAALSEEITLQARQIGAEIGAQQAALLQADLQETVLTATEMVDAQKVLAQRGLRTAITLLREIEAANTNQEIFVAELAQAKKSDLARAALVDRLLGTRGRLDAFEKWGAAVARLAAVQRGAYEFAGGDKSDSIDELIKRIHAERLANKDS